MNTLIYSILYLFTPVASGDLYRCHSADGTLHVQGLPCQTETSGAAHNDTDDDSMLKMWVDEKTALVRPSVHASRSESMAADRHRTVDGKFDRATLNYEPPVLLKPAIKPVSRMVRAAQLPNLPADKNLPACSIQFYQCTAEPGRLMDACVDKIRICESGNTTQCCNVGYIMRFQQLRASQYDRQSATRLALLGQP